MGQVETMWARWRWVGLAAASLGLQACSGSAGAKTHKAYIFKPAPQEGAAAKINGQIITTQELVKDDQLALYELEVALYKFKKELVDKRRIQEVIGVKAKAANMSLEEFVEKKVVGSLKVSENEFQAFLTDRKIEASKVTPDVREKINSYLTMSKRNDKMTQFMAEQGGEPSELYFSKPRLNLNLEVGDAPTMGKSDAPVTIFEFSDFECQYCAGGAKTVAELKKKYGNKLRFVFKHFPLAFHRFALGTAEASMCVNDQGSDLFWKFHNEVFAHQEKLDADSLEGYAKKVGAKIEDYKECVAAKRFASVVQNELNYAQRKGVRSTPSFFVNGQPAPSGAQMKDFDELIQEELEQANDSK